MGSSYQLTYNDAKNEAERKINEMAIAANILRDKVSGSKIKEMYDTANVVTSAVKHLHAYSDNFKLSNKRQ